MKENQYVLNELLARALDASGLKQKELAGLAGVSRQSVNAALHGKRPLSEAAFGRYMAAMGYYEHDMQQSPRGDLVVTFWAGSFASENNQKKVSG